MLSRLLSRLDVINVNSLSTFISSRVAGLAACVVALAWSSPVQAQLEVSDPRATRAALATRASAIETSMSSASSDKERTRLRFELDSIKSRLTNGDFVVGDQFVITLVWDSVSADTASVRADHLVSVRRVPDFSAKGVLRSELTEALNTHVSRYLKNAIVRTNVFMRVAVVGAVANPGFYSLSPDRPLSELLMRAGGPAAQAKLDELEVKRSGRVILTRKASKRALLEGRTMEQIGMKPGDEVVVPQSRRFNWQQIIQVLFIFSSLFFAFIQFIQWYYREE